MWRMIGVDPVNLHVDAHLPDLYNAESPAIHTMAPLRGSVTGRAAVYGLSGRRLTEGYCDLSHFGLGNRHRGGFIPLPLVYTDLHQMVRQCICILILSLTFAISSSDSLLFFRTDYIPRLPPWTVCGRASTVPALRSDPECWDTWSRGRYGLHTAWSGRMHTSRSGLWCGCGGVLSRTQVLCAAHEGVQNLSLPLHIPRSERR